MNAPPRWEVFITRSHIVGQLIKSGNYLKNREKVEELLDNRLKLSKEYGLDPPLTILEILDYGYSRGESGVGWVQIILKERDFNFTNYLINIELEISTPELRSNAFELISYLIYGIDINMGELMRKYKKIRLIRRDYFTDWMEDTILNQV